MVGVKIKSWGLVALAVILVLIVGGIIGLRIAAGMLKGKVVEALGPGSEIQAVQVGWSGVEVHSLRIKGPRGWPVTDALRAERVVIFPSLRSLWSDTIRIRTVTVVRPYLSAVRTRDGRLRVLPTLLEAPDPAPKGKPPAGPAMPSVAISRILVKDGVVDLFNYAVAPSPLKIHLEKIRATVRNVAVPGLKGKSRFDLGAVVKGIQHDGRAKIVGWAEIASKDSSVKTELRSLDLVALQPYLIQASDARLQRGSLDLDLQSEVRNNRLRAPGTVVISDLEFAPSRDTSETFMGVPRSAVVNFLKNRDNKIAINFTIEGDLSNPQFTLREALATRVAAGLAELLGVSIRGLAEGVGTLGGKGVEAVGEAARGLGGALQQLFGGKNR
jgi:uncharacterized protein involved in outer membrane biogenesis